TISMQQDAAGYSEDGDQDACRECLAGCEQATLQHVLLDSDPRESSDDVGWHRDNEAVDQTDADEKLYQPDEHDERKQPERGGRAPHPGQRNGGHRVSASRSFSLSCSCNPRLASSRRSLQIWATKRPNASLEPISQLRGRANANTPCCFH